MSYALRAKRVLIGALAGAMVLSLMPAGVASASLEDVCENAPDSGFPDKGTTHGDNIDCMFAYDVFQGRADGTFGTFANITRGQAAVFFVNFALAATDGDLDVPEVDVPFTDMGNVFDEEIAILYSLGLVDGTTDTTYSPAAQITRGQFAKILFEAHELLGVEFDDEYDEAFPDEGGTFGAEIRALAGEGIISGFADGTFRPFTNITRGAAASLLAESAGVLDSLDLWDAPRLPAPVQPSLADGPELIDVEFVSATSTQTLVEFVFDTDIESLPGVNETTTLLQRVDGGEISAQTQPIILSSDESRVRAVFSNADYAQATVAVFPRAAALDIDGNESVAASYPLKSVSYDGNVTDDPDITGVSVVAGSLDVELDGDGDLEAATFTARTTFNQAVAATDFNSATLFTTDGARHDFDSVTDGPGNSLDVVISVNLDPATATEPGLSNANQVALLDAADAEAALAGLVGRVVTEDSDGRIQSLNVAALANTPSISSAAWDVASDEVVLTLDRRISATQTATDTVVGLVYQDGSIATQTVDWGTAAIARTSDRTVTISFGDGEVNEAVAGIFVGEGLIDGFGAQVRTNRDQAFGWTRNVNAGFTVAPRLMSADVETTATSLDAAGNVIPTQITFTLNFDRAASDTVGTDFSVFAYTSGEDPVEVDGDIDVDGDEVTIEIARPSGAVAQAQFEALLDVEAVDISSDGVEGEQLTDGATAALNYSRIVAAQ